MEDNYRLFQLAATNIREQVEEPLYHENLERLAAVPRRRKLSIGFGCFNARPH